MRIILNDWSPCGESQLIQSIFRILLVLNISLGIVSTGHTADKEKTEPSVGEEKSKDKKKKKKKKKPKDPNRPAFVGAPIPIINPTVGWGLGAIAMVNYSLVKSDKISPDLTPP